MILIKSSRELERMRRAGRLVAECHAALAERIRPGITTAELDAFVEDYIRRRGGTPTYKGYRGFPASICTSVNDVVCHGIPGRQRLREGDVITVDVGVTLDGYHGDSAWTYAVGEVSPEARRLMEIGEACLNAGIAQARPGNRLGDIGHAIQSLAEAHGYGVVRDFVGHGIGRRLHEDPDVPHFGTPGTGIPLRAGMTLCIEPMITLGDWRVLIDDDGWTARTRDGSLSVQYEHTIAITEGEAEILTTLGGSS